MHGRMWIVREPCFLQYRFIDVGGEDLHVWACVHVCKIFGYQNGDVVGFFVVRVIGCLDVHCIGCAFIV